MDETLKLHLDEVIAKGRLNKNIVYEDCKTVIQTFQSKWPQMNIDYDQALRYSCVNIPY